MLAMCERPGAVTGWRTHGRGADQQRTCGSAEHLERRATRQPGHWQMIYGEKLPNSESGVRNSE